MIKVNNKCGLSKPGIRDNNEDYILWQESSRIFVLCDGMGGHGHGEVASRVVSESVHGFLDNLAKEAYEPSDLQDALNCSLEQLAKEDNYDDEKRMGTTLVVVVINKQNVLVGHVGDSRCYQFDKDCLKKFCTKDHSKVQEAVDAEILTEEEAHTSAHKNILTRCVMAGKDKVDVEVDVLSIEDGDRLLLCSDGVVDALWDKEIQEILISRTSEEALSIIESECQAKSRDNFSAILLDLSQDEKPKRMDVMNDNDSMEDLLDTDDQPTDFDNNLPSKEEPKPDSFLLRNKTYLSLFGAFVLGCAVASCACIWHGNKNNAELTKSKSAAECSQKELDNFKNSLDEFMKKQCDTTVRDTNNQPVLTLDKAQLYQSYRNFIKKSK